MKSFFALYKPFFFFMPVLLCVFSCKPENEPDPIQPVNPQNPGNVEPITADEASNYLVFDNADKIIGNLPAVQNGDLKLDFKDTLYVIKGHPYKARISVLHDTLLTVTGFYVEASGASHFYDVPTVLEERNDSIDVAYIGLDIPEDKAEFPYTLQINIQPHDEDGTALKEFKRYITIEDPNDPNRCEIYTPNDAWRWMYTELFISKDYFQITAPLFNATYRAFEVAGGYRYGLCCIDDPDFGLITAYPGDPTREGICNDKNPLYKGVYVSSFSLNTNTFLFIFSNGKFIHYTGIFTSNFNPKKSRICDLFAYYDRTWTDYINTGVHDYTPRANRIKLTTQASNQTFSPNPPSGEIINTCHLLIFTFRIEGTTTVVYQRYPGLASNSPPDPMDYLHYWFEF